MDINNQEDAMQRFMTIAATMCLAAGAFAAQAKTLSVTESVDIKAPPEKVWDLAGDFGGIHRWHPAAKSTDITKGEKDKPGAERTITLQDGGKIMERLTARNAKTMTYTYVILDGVLPVSNYRSTMTVTRAGKDMSKVKWTSTFSAKKGSDDKTAVDAITGVYKGGLENLKKVAEQ
jgi:uncharacterized protein YndB with AHSA1/START domain